MSSGSYNSQNFENIFREVQLSSTSKSDIDALKYALSYREAIRLGSEDATSTLIEEFYSQHNKTFLNKTGSQYTLADKVHKYVGNVDLAKWTSSLDCSNYAANNAKKFVKCGSSCMVNEVIHIENKFNLKPSISPQRRKHQVNKPVFECSDLKKNCEVSPNKKSISDGTTRWNAEVFATNENLDNNPNISQNALSAPLKLIKKEKKISEGAFKTARDELITQQGRMFGQASTSNYNYGMSKKYLGTRRTPQSEFVPPIKQKEENTQQQLKPITDTLQDDRLEHIDPKMVELITSEIMNNLDTITWDDIAGLNYAKSVIQEAVIWPILRPDIFTGIRRPPKGILFFGPPGTGKTLIGKCIASQSKSTFFSISASSLTSKWIGDGEKMVRTLFAVAAVNQPAVIFIDEIDSLLNQRSETEHESSRRLKTEFLIHLDGASTSKDDRILIVGATNRPQELDEAARRRFVRRLYIPLPELEARVQILSNLLKNIDTVLSPHDLNDIGRMTEGYSGADMASLCQEASMEPIRSIPANEMLQINQNNIRAVNVADFYVAIKTIRPSVAPKDLNQYLEWDALYGSGGR